jgi:predicted Zn-dependent peptidase
LHVAPSRKFKTVIVKAFLRTDLTSETATEVATLPYVLRHGTRGVPSKRLLSQALESLYGGSLGVDVLKLGEEQVITFGLQVLGDRYLPKGTDALRQGLKLLADLIQDPALEDGAEALRRAEVDQEKEKLRRFVAGLINDKGTYAAHRCVKTLCADEPYGVFEYGAVEDLDALDGAKLEACRRRLLRDAELDIYVVGPVAADIAEELIREAFRIERDGAATLRGTTQHPAPTDPREVREAMEGLSQSKLCMGFRSEIRLRDDNFFDQLLMHGVLGGFPHSKLFRNVREKAGLCYDASSSMERFKGLLFIFAGIDAENFEQTRDLCLEQVAAIARGEVDDGQLTNTRLSFRRAYQALLDFPGRMLNLDYLLRLGGRSCNPVDLIAAVDAVTLEGIQAAAAQLRLDTVYFLEPALEPLDAPVVQAAS